MAIAPQSSVTYPVSDGEPLGETDQHRKQTTDVIDALIRYYADRPEVYVSGDNFLYYVEGNPRRVVSPDCYIVFGAGMRLRDIYKVWEEGDRMPSVVMEITSKQTQDVDVGRKFELYEQVLHVPEYFLFDPKGEYLHPRLQGYRLVGERYEALEWAGDRLHSEQLGLDLVVREGWLRLYDPIRDEWLLSSMELEQAWIAETDRADAEARRADTEARRADIEAEARMAEAGRADAEAQARQEAEAELVRLRAELEALRRSSQE